MSELNDTRPTLLDLSKRLDPNNQVARIIEMLSQTNEILDDVPYMEGNMPNGHQTTVRTGLPTPTWRKLYGGVQPTKSTTTPIIARCGMLEAYNEVDVALAQMSGNVAEFRLSEARPTMESMNQEIASTMFFGNETTEPEAFTGFAAHYNSLSANNADNIITGGSADTDNTSIYLLVWGPDTVHCIYPRGSTAGLSFKDLGEVTVENIDGSNGRMQAYRSHFRWDVGLAVRDWRYGVRICNIEKSALTKDASSGADLPDLMFQAIERIPNMNMGRAAFYMSRGTLTKLRQQLAYGVKNSTLTYEDLGGRKNVAMFQGIPIRRVDALAADEALVS